MARGKFEYWLTEDGLALLKEWARDGITDSASGVISTKNVYAKENISNKRLIEELKRPVMHECVGKEKDFEENVLANIDLICDCLNLPDIKAVDGQKMISAGGFFIKPDIMVRHIDGTMTVFEVKKANEKHPSTGTSNQMNAVGQLLLYGNVLSEIIDNKVRLALIDNKIYYRTFCAFLNNHLPITLLDFQKDRLFVPYNGWGVGSG